MTATLGGLVGAFRDSANKWALRNYVNDLVDQHDGYKAEQREQIKDALGITGSGGFGFRLRVAAPRGFVRSDAVGSAGGLPDLGVWHNDGNANTRIDLKILAGLDATTFWQRGRPQVEGDNGASIDGSDIDTYLANPTASGTKQFTIRCMSEGDFGFKLDTAAAKASELGLELQFDRADQQLTRQNMVRIPASPPGMKAFLTGAPFNRADGTTDPAGAVRDLCTPLCAGSFLFQDNSFIGYSAHLNDSTCVDDGSTFGGDGLTGTVFRDKKLKAEGNVYVVDAAFGNFQIFNPEGELLMYVGNRNERGGPGEYLLPSGIAVDVDGRIYFVDQWFRKVDIFRPFTRKQNEGYLGRAIFAPPSEKK